MKFALAATLLATFLPHSAASGGGCECDGFEFIDFVEAPDFCGRRLESDAGDDANLRATSPDDEKHRMLSPGKRGPGIYDFLPCGPLTPPQWHLFITYGVSANPFYNCILAPVESEEDLTAIRDARDGSSFMDDNLRAEDIVVGVYKDPAEAAECVDEDVENCRSNWENVDGSSVPSSTEIWAGARRPNDSGNFAFLTSGGRDTKLDSALSTDEFNYAAIKCCAIGPVCYDTELPFGRGDRPPF